jgi:hypothetical protein
MEETGIEKKGVTLGEPPANTDLKKVQKDAGKDAVDYYKSIIDKMAKNQKTNVEMPDNTKIEKSYDNALTKEEFEPKKYNIEDDERKMYYGSGMEGLRYDSDGTERQEEFDERVDELNGGDEEGTTYGNEEGATYGNLKKDGKNYKKYKYGEEKYDESEDEYQETPKVRTTVKESMKNKIERNPSNLTEAANEDLELKSLAKKIWSIMKKNGLSVEYVTDKIDYRSAASKDIPALLQIGKNVRGGMDNVLTVAVYERALQNLVGAGQGKNIINPSKDETVEINKKAGTIFKEIMNLIGDEFVQKHQIKPNDYGYYLLWIKKKSNNKNENKEMKYADVIKENIFKAKGKLVSEEQVIKLANKVPNRVKIDETVFAITDGDNTYRLIWEGESEDGEPTITHHKDKEMVNEDKQKMFHLMGFKSSDSISTKKTITESGEDAFKRMWNKIKEDK